MDSEHYTITDTSISPSDFKCRVLCISMTIQYVSLINHKMFYSSFQNCNDHDPEKCKMFSFLSLYNKILLSQLTKIVQKNIKTLLFSVSDFYFLFQVRKYPCGTVQLEWRRPCPLVLLEHQYRQEPVPPQNGLTNTELKKEHHN